MNGYLATCIDLEPCIITRECYGEALEKARAGQVLSPEKGRNVQDADVVP